MLLLEFTSHRTNAEVCAAMLAVNGEPALEQLFVCGG
jgi:hypothetical protein